MDFVLNTLAEQEQMLKVIGVKKIEDLFKDVPKNLLSDSLKFSVGKSELETRMHLFELSKKNANALDFDFFLGGGVYNHFVPAIVWHLVLRGEFLTSYTPYQPEVSQGMLQAIFEWQTYVCELTGMQATNASNYDGAEATAQAVLMLKNISKRKKVLVLGSINPEYLAVARTYARTNEIVFAELPFMQGNSLFELLESKIDNETAGVIVQSPNFFGCIEDLQKIAMLAHENGCLLVVIVPEMLSLGLIKSPGELGADIVVGDAQSFGIPMSFGGPFAGIIATKMEFVRHLPGRIVGQTIDSKNKKGYIMTLQAREQHIRREKANSSICTNQALCALAATIYLGLAGKTGLKGLAELNHAKALWLYEQFLQIKGIDFPFSGPFFNEFVVRIKGLHGIRQKLLGKKIVFGLSLEKWFPELKDCCLVSVTEMNSDESLERLVKELQMAIWK